MDDFENGVHLDIAQGESLDLPITYQDDNDNPINLTGFTARMQIRQTVGGSQVIADLSTANGSINIDGFNGGVDVFIPSSTTKDFPAGFDGVYDLWLYASGGIAIKLISGTIHVTGRVTR